MFTIPQQTILRNLHKLNSAQKEELLRILVTHSSDLTCYHIEKIIEFNTAQNNKEEK